jgi:hypothetical protein
VIVEFIRTGQRRYAVAVEREGAPRLVMDPAPGYDERLPHDLLHLAVEQEHGITFGVFGQVAAGGDAGTFHRADGVADRRLRRRGERLVRAHGDDLARSEELAYRALVAFARGEPAGDRLAALSRRWQALGIGEAMRVPWEPAPRARPARARRRPR